MSLPLLIEALGKIINTENIEQVSELVEKLIVLGEQIESSLASGLSQNATNNASSSKQ